MKAKNLELSGNELSSLKIVLYAEVAKYYDRVGHAASHGDEYQDAHAEALCRIVEKVEKE